MKGISLKKITQVLKKNIWLIVLFITVFGMTNCYSQSEKQKIDILINKKKEFNKNNKNSVIYKIQLYNGNEIEAYKKKYKFSSLFPEYKVTIRYEQPDWKTQVGEFITRLEADKVLKIVRTKYPGAIVLEDRI